MSGWYAGDGCDSRWCGTEALNREGHGSTRFGKVVDEYTRLLDIAVHVGVAVGILSPVGYFGLDGSWSKVEPSRDPKIGRISIVRAPLQVVFPIGTEQGNTVVVAVARPSRLSGMAAFIVEIFRVVDMPNKDATVVQQLVPIDRLSVLNQQVLAGWVWVRNNEYFWL